MLYFEKTTFQKKKPRFVASGAKLRASEPGQEEAVFIYLFIFFMYLVFLFIVLRERTRARLLRQTYEDSVAYLRRGLRL